MRMPSFPSVKAYSTIAFAIAIFGIPRFAAAEEADFKVQIVADDMCCKGCAQKCAAQLYALPGVTSVEADVPNRLVTVTAKPSPKLTIDRIWQAVERGKGGPSQITTAHTSYVILRAENIKPEDRLPPGKYSLELRTLEDKVLAQKIANQLYVIPGVQTVSLDSAQRTLLLQAKKGTVLSPWALAAAAERAEGEPVAIGGPHGVLQIERLAEAGRANSPEDSLPREGGLQ